MTAYCNSNIHGSQHDVAGWLSIYLSKVSVWLKDVCDLYMSFARGQITRVLFHFVFACACVHMFIIQWLVWNVVKLDSGLCTLSCGVTQPAYVYVGRQCHANITFLIYELSFVVVRVASDRPSNRN